MAPAYQSPSQVASEDGGSRLSMQTKMSCALVSTAWNKLAMPLLYEQISLRRIDHVHSCARALGSSLQTTSKEEEVDERTQQSRHLGWHTKRLEIAFSFLPPEGVKWGAEDFERLSFILKTCPNLKVVALDPLSKQPWESSIIAQVIEDHPQLRHLQWGERCSALTPFPSTLKY
jgi:hypothetical protein